MSRKVESETFARAATSEIVMSSQLRSPASSKSASMIAFRGSLGAAAMSPDLDWGPHRRCRLGARQPCSVPRATIRFSVKSTSHLVPAKPTSKGGFADAPLQASFGAILEAPRGPYVRPLWPTGAILFMGQRHLHRSAGLVARRSSGFSN